MSRDIKLPEIVIPSSIDAPTAELYTTPSGVEVMYINVGSQDVIRYSLVFNAGVKFQKAAFVASATVNMLSEGAGDMSARQIAEMLDFYGIYYDVNIDRDYTVVTICALSRFSDKALKLLEKFVTAPHFHEEELETYRTKRKQALAVEREKVDFQARERFAEALFGKEHPYGSISDEKNYDNLTRDMLQGYFKEFYNRNNLFAVVSGKVSMGDVEALSAIIETLPKGRRADGDITIPINSTPRVAIKRDGALQSAIRVGCVCFDRMHPDFIGMQIVATILGGYFGSRLVMNLREDKGYTYGAFSAMVNMARSGYMAITTEVRADATDAALEQIYYEIDRISSELVDEQELGMVKSVMVGEVMRILDGPFGIADVTIENHQNGTDNSYVSKMVEEIVATTPERLLELCQKYLKRENFVEIIIGNV